MESQIPIKSWKRSIIFQKALEFIQEFMEDLELLAIRRKLEYAKCFNWKQ